MLNINIPLEIPNSIFEQMVQQAQDHSPIEACGILAGRDNLVKKLYKTVNADQSPNHFMIAPQEQFKIIKDIRSTGYQMLAIYHSHPETPARPSQEDILLALTPDVIYIIISLKDTEPVMKGFLIENGNVTEIPIKIKT